MRDEERNEELRRPSLSARAFQMPRSWLFPSSSPSSLPLPVPFSFALYRFDPGAIAKLSIWHPLSRTQSQRPSRVKRYFRTRYFFLFPEEVRIGPSSATKKQIRRQTLPTFALCIQRIVSKGNERAAIIKSSFSLPLEADFPLRGCAVLIS